MPLTRQAYVISDLHLGAGDAEPRLEDFFQDAQFASFLEGIASPETTLYINGDFIDFPQIPPYDVSQEDDLLWTEETSLAKLELALKAHTKCFSAIAAFLARGSQLVLLIGNHDLDLAWPKVQDRLRSVVGDPAKESLRITIGVEEYHGVLIEHGHSFTPENCPIDTWRFIHRSNPPDGQPCDYLERVWGTDFMLSFYNDLERKHPFADNVKPMASVLYQGIKNGWVGVDELVRFVAFLKRRGIPMDAVKTSVLGEKPEAPRLDHVLGGLIDEGWREAVRERAAHDGRFVADVDRALRMLPEWQRRALVEGMPVATGLERRDLIRDEDGATLGLLGASREEKAAKTWLSVGKISTVVFGHTHEIVDGALGKCLYNPGTWIPKLNLRDTAVRQKIKKHGLTLEMLSDSSLYVVERRTVHIVPDGNNRAKVSLLTI
jgi:UDP-2,3-diacylglucosamine pyrophosphatase LpxH